mmetsp:Transcript_83850/g.227323  ORF Transcript_83850/g.227323 Transcript_83850/m.227323 type:complete len:248 (+) Transcript_83850:77-820(+)
MKAVRGIALLVVASCVAAERLGAGLGVQLDARGRGIHTHSRSSRSVNARPALVQTGCDKGPATVKTVEVIIMVEKANQTFIMTKMSPEDGKHMNMGGSFYSQCGQDDFHPDACGPAFCAPAGSDMPATYNGKPFDQGEASQLSWACKKILDEVPRGFSNYVDFLEKKGVRRITLKGDGEKTYRTYPLKLTGIDDGQLEKFMEVKGFQLVECSSIMRGEQDSAMQSSLSEVVKQLHLRGCEGNLSVSG